jgi:CheY-like chemotaxis protein
MKIVQDSPEHHFLTFLEQMKKDAEGWYGIQISLSKKLKHGELLSDLGTISKKLQKLYEESAACLESIGSEFSNFEKVTAYLFPDSDIILLIKAGDTEKQDQLFDIQKQLANKFGPKLCEYSDISKQLYNYQKLADKKFLSTTRIEAYKALTDQNRVSSIAVRRKRHTDPVVLIVEDDRFTSNYAAGILSKEYDVVTAKTGEEAILKHIESAPDMVFLDIHLPGLNGHETLQAIKQADPNAFVVMLSVDTVKTNIVSATQKGAAGFLKKPFSKDRLLHATMQSPFIRQIKSGAKNA